MGPAAVISTYRLQLRPDGFTFAEAEALLDYLDELGVSHLYLSPVLTAAAGSPHGYDVTDPTTVSASLGGPDGLARLSAAARRRGMGLVVDIVPNHVGVDPPERNRWWWDVLRHGADSLYAPYFDIDWDLDPDGRIVLPLLGSDDDLVRLTVDDATPELKTVLRLDELRLPIPLGTGDGTPAEIHDRQHYRLVGWRRGVCGYRRFFTVTSLAALRQEDRAVFDASHVEVRRWFGAGLVDGVRVDHPDGLSDPIGYLTWLRELTGPDTWIVVEKILAVDEPLDPALPVDGTTGYDALREIGGVFVDPAGASVLTELSGRVAVPARTRELKAEAVTGTLSAELRRVCRAVSAGTGAEHPLLADAVVALVSRIGVYRSDYPGLATVTATALAETVIDQPRLTEPLQIVAAALVAGGEAAVRIQQLCGAATAKAIEDCLFYRDARLVSLNEVGGDPAYFGVSSAELHQRAAARARLWPRAMTTLSTHDTKRGEDVRARIGVLSQVPSRWAELVTDWQRRIPCPDAGTGLFLLQNIFGVWPSGGHVDTELRERLHRFTEKAIREAGTHTSWTTPDIGFEAGLQRWLDTFIDGPAAEELTAFVDELDPHARSDSLGQKLLQLTAPGVPDVYQGTELWEDSLVDPDNRRPVDYAARRAALKSLTHPKIRVVTAALRLRRERPASFLAGGYRPVLPSGPAARHIVAFLRGGDVLTAVTRWTVRLAETGWGHTVVPLPDGTWTDRLTGTTWRADAPAGRLFTDLPVALLERTGA